MCWISCLYQVAEVHRVVVAHMLWVVNATSYMTCTRRHWPVQGKEQFVIHIEKDVMPSVL